MRFVVVTATQPDWVTAAFEAAAAPDFPLRSTDETAVVLLQPGDFVEPEVLAAASRCFADRKVGAVQVRMRLHPPGRRLFLRLQEMELAAYSDLVLGSGRTVGAPGYGPSGFLVRLSALRRLDAAGGDDLTVAGADDVAIGVELARAGLSVAFCGGRGVARPALSSVARLVSSRAWALAGWVRVCARHTYALPPAGPAVRALIEPFLLVTTALIAPVALGGLVAAASAGRALSAPRGAEWLAWYLVLFGSAWFIGYVGWLRRGRGTLVGSILLGHVFVLYSLYWLPATWLALARVVFRRRPPAARGEAVEAANAIQIVG